MRVAHAFLALNLAALPFEKAVAFSPSPPVRATKGGTTQLPFKDHELEVPGVAAPIDNKTIEQAMKTLTKTRPYPLFLAEKAAGVIEGAVKTNPSVHHSKENDFSSEQKTKERVVVLGVGWGAAAFLKSVDTDRYDVTVISPRNQ